MVTAPVRRVVWLPSSRIIRSIYLPIDLFDDIDDPTDWKELASAKAKFNPRTRDSIGDLAKVSVARRVTGLEASWVMAPFIHCSPLRPRRFSGETFGLYYVGDSTEVTIAETIHHHTKMMLATAEAPGWTSQFRELIRLVDADLDEVAGIAHLLNTGDYTASQVFGAQRRTAWSNGITWLSVLNPGGNWIAAFLQDVVPIPTQGGHFAYRWNGAAVDFINKLDTGEVMEVR